MRVDTLILSVDKALRTLFVNSSIGRGSPSDGLSDHALAAGERARSEGLMRVNHVGEVCAQALYQGQALTCRDASIRRSLEAAADEEVEHLAWTAGRLAELGGRKSVLNPLWYLGAWSIGALAGKCGDAWSLGFLAETERQVEAHLSGHLEILPEEDVRSRAIVAQMKADERRHADMAVALGAESLPDAARAGMRLVAKVMTKTAYYL
ncbi:2-polyprenyl-3-methyl-6-methoxy-1,4-benzoquinone monooxygenase [uncultured Propionivibrio sp.]|uniref:2-polyprenyl-3-methyl-6-methoxy-1,4-benzoquinone monooxygenase n=1 Tax=uncultured Propionivibrio sp. TaxID=426737 RepID=UPI0029BFCED2|nr:2-polyprenyl-3-methyl-6-methoxy-1,4-benzoquinone monooxygenase [uncultured Propionivibrio sp.]